MDENGWPAKFPQALWKDNVGSEEGSLRAQNRQQLQCEFVRRKQVLRPIDYKFTRRNQLLPRRLLHHCRGALYHVWNNLLHCIHG